MNWIKWSDSTPKSDQMAIFAVKAPNGRFYPVMGTIECSFENEIKLGLHLPVYWMAIPELPEEINV